jgi:hypothetical protein
VALAQPSDLALDAYSARGLLNAAPRSASVLSSLRLTPDRFLQRYAVVAQSGGLASASLCWAVAARFISVLAQAQSRRSRLCHTWLELPVLKSDRCCS